MSKRKWQLLAVVLVAAFFALSGVIQAQVSLTFRAQDPGVRGGPAGAGDPIANLSADENEMFEVGLEDFSEEEGVADGVGPRFNFVGCKGCHIQPAVGGTSPAVNPLFRVPGELGFTGNVVLKSCEATAKAMMKWIKEEIVKSPIRFALGYVGVAPISLKKSGLLGAQSPDSVLLGTGGLGDGRTDGCAGGAVLRVQSRTPFAGRSPAALD